MATLPFRDMGSPCVVGVQIGGSERCSSTSVQAPVGASGDHDSPYR
ncbi:hypothetical protein ACFFX0_19735 [Citricoccus parietis]|uniref:Uncharacterized protein n=1 Tax=Citricoccus parietis TaxID=592307 RepID=A0ABV5G2Z7_9MICC